mmetsp:Transcript_22506/g.67487  ORF Transcript_22506/g.67487 Transcript_22506/m.67487 type:complete len:470 (+) Transcript_22506:498-1907(+)
MVFRPQRRPGGGHQLFADVLRGGGRAGAIRGHGVSGLPGGRAHLPRRAALRGGLHRSRPLADVGGGEVPQRCLLHRLARELLRREPRRCQGTGDLRLLFGPGRGAAGIRPGDARAAGVLRAGQPGLVPRRGGVQGRDRVVPQGRPPLPGAGDGRERRALPPPRRAGRWRQRERGWRHGERDVGLSGRVSRQKGQEELGHARQVGDRACGGSPRWDVGPRVGAVPDDGGEAPLDDVPVVRQPRRAARQARRAGAAVCRRGRQKVPLRLPAGRDPPAGVAVRGRPDGGLRRHRSGARAQRGRREGRVHSVHALRRRVLPVPHRAPRGGSGHAAEIGRALARPPVVLLGAHEDHAAVPALGGGDEGRVSGGRRAEPVHAGVRGKNPERLGARGVGLDVGGLQHIVFGHLRPGGWLGVREHTERREARVHRRACDVPFRDCLRGQARAVLRQHVQHPQEQKGFPPRAARARRP